MSRPPLHQIKKYQSNHHFHFIVCSFIILFKYKNSYTAPYNFFSILNTICSLTRAYIYSTTAKEYLCTLLRANCAINLTQLMHFLSRKLRQLLLSIVNSSLVVYIGAIIIFWLRSPRYFIDFEMSDFFFFSASFF